MTTLYLSGPMRSKPNHNRELFLEVEEALFKYGLPLPEGDSLNVLNPTRNFNGDQTLEPSIYMTLDLKQVLDADVIVLLPDWRTSEGARREVQLAIWARKL